jgi:PncC family amidohydrolase
MINPVFDKIIKKLREKHHTLGFAESCTGGLLSHNITIIPGVSDVYHGAIVSYANSTKTQLLGVADSLIQKDGAVSEAVVQEMAKGARKSLNCDWAVSISGVAGPTGGTPEKPVGTVWFAVSGPDVEKSEKKNFSGSRVEIQRQSANFAADFLLNCLGL